MTACEQDQDGSCTQAVSKPVWHTPLLCVQWKTLDVGQMNCPKHVEFYSKNKFEKLMHLVGFIIRIYHDARSPERPPKKKLITPKFDFNFNTVMCLLFVSDTAICGCTARWEFQILTKCLSIYHWEIGRLFSFGCLCVAYPSFKLIENKFVNS